MTRAAPAERRPACEPRRKAGILRVKALYLEPEVAIDDELRADIAGALRSCAEWHRTPEVVIERAEPAALLGPLRDALRLA